MGGKAKIALALVLGALLALGGLGCDGGDSSSADGSGTSAPQGAAEGRTAAAGQASQQPKGSSAEFLTPGGDNSIQTYGKEADKAERSAASEVLEAFMAARADQDWEAACAALNAEAFEPLEKLVAPGSGCVATLAAVAKKLEPSSWENTMTGPIAVLRREREHAFALYHGTANTDYFIQMTNEGGTWKVATLEPTAFP
jgi:hypothetical protein